MGPIDSVPARQRGGKSLPELGIVGHILTLDREAPLALLQQINDIVHA